MGMMYTKITSIRVKKMIQEIKAGKGFKNDAEKGVARDAGARNPREFRQVLATIDPKCLDVDESKNELGPNRC